MQMINKLGKWRWGRTVEAMWPVFCLDGRVQEGGEALIMQEDHLLLFVIASEGLRVPRVAFRSQQRASIACGARGDWISQPDKMVTHIILVTV